MKLLQFLRDTFNPSPELRALQQVCGEVYRVPYRYYFGWDLRPLGPKDSGNCAAKAYTAFLELVGHPDLRGACFAFVTVRTWKGDGHAQLEVRAKRTWYVDPTFNTVSEKPMCPPLARYETPAWPALKARYAAQQAAQKQGVKA